MFIRRWTATVTKMERHRWLRKKRRKKKKKERRQRKKKKSQDEASLAPSRANIEEDEGGAVVRVSPVITGVGYNRRNVARGSCPGARGAVRGYTYIINIHGEIVANRGYL
ncbi:hypothetical protein HID58_076463 [Brassica napus]|uniref:Uncharacterized protein n=1 Tax=Brassica napus TaxID=3708 RepID=A0ABQ7YQN7_BRANA|nr:hypothetical protein HID58_076463 [Brassica napus]